MKEAAVTIDGVHLNDAQSMTLRVAVSQFKMQMVEPNALGEREHNEKMRKLYLARLGEIEELLLAGCRP